MKSDRVIVVKVYYIDLIEGKGPTCHTLKFL